MRNGTTLPAIACLVALAASPSLSAGQGTARPLIASVRGVVYDSIRGRPLRDAFVSITGGELSTTTDDRGRFHFDSVPHGMRTFTVQHASLDSLGFSGLTKRATIGDEGGEVRVAVPSFATLWRSVCGSTRAPSDSGLIYGTIRDAHSGKGVSNAAIDLSWSELAVRSRRQLIDRRWKSETKTAANGDYAVCGIPLDASLTIHAATDSSQTGVIVLAMTGLKVQRRDLVVGATKGTAAATHGVITGLLTDQAGTPFPDARVLVESQEARSDYDGHFLLTDVPVGSRQIEVRFVGLSPVLSVVDVPAADTAIVSLQMPRITSLATVHVTSPERARMLREEYEERKIMYSRYMKDTTEINRLTSLPNIFYGLPSITVKRVANGDLMLLTPDGRGSSCAPELRVDGALVNDFSTLNSLPPNRVLSVEVYPRAADVPSEYQRGGVRYRCGLVAIWTKWAFRIP